MAATCTFLWVAIKEKDFRDFLNYYKPERGGYIGQDGNWVERKIIWQAWGWYGVLVLIVLSLPLLILYVFLWGRFIEPVTEKGPLWGPFPSGRRKMKKPTC